MKNLKEIAKSAVVLSALALAVAAVPARAETSEKAFLDARANLKADALIKLESATGVVLGPNSQLRVMGAKVTSASDTEIRAHAAFGNSSLSFIVKIDSDTRLNGGKSAGAGDLKAGDKISFSGAIASSTSSAITVDADHVVSRALAANPENKTTWKGEVKSVADGSVTIELASGRAVKVNVSNSTSITLDGVVSALASLDEGDEVVVSGSLSADGSAISATKISAESDDNDDNDDDEDKDKDDDRHDDREDNSGRGNGWWNRIFKWFDR